MRLIMIGMLVAAAAQGQGEAPVPDRNPHTTAADVEQGRRLFDGRCAGCHGKGGVGDRGPNLAQPTLVHATDDASLFRVIRRGIPGTDMPSTHLATDREIWQLAAYVRSLGRQPLEKVTGNVAAGGPCSGARLDVSVATLLVLKEDGWGQS